MSGEFTLIELSKIETDTLRKSVIDTLLMEAVAMQMLPWETIGQLATTVVRLGSLPSVGFRKVNEGYSVGTGSFEQKVENISLMGGYFDTDKAIARAKNTIASARAITQVMMTKAIAYKFNDKFINGNPQTDPEEFKGCKERVTDVYNEGYTGQLVDFECDGVGILNSSAHSNDFLNFLDKLIYQIPGHKPDFLWMNHKLLLAIRAILRKEKLLSSMTDYNNVVVDTYGNTRLVDIGVKQDQTTEIILNTETAAGAATGGESTSLYATKFGIGDMLWGIQEYPLEVTDKGLLEDKPIYRTELDWPLGLAQANPYAIARGIDIIADSSA
ncbi:MAG: major capsid protein [Eubacteriales bacterium]|jgi:hypothetical protein